MSPTTLVVGGGLAGLLAARRAQRAGEHVVLLEQEEELGGALAAREVGGVLLNAGAEAYSTASGAVDALVAELGLTDRVVSPRAGLGSRIVSEAGTHRAPASALLGIPAHPLAADVRAVLGPLGSLRAALEPLLPARVGARPGASVEQLVTRRLGRRVARRLVAPVVGGVHSADPATLEFAAASPQLTAGLARHGSLLRAVRALRGGSTRSAGTRVHALTPTMAALPAALAEQLRAGGAELRPGVTVTAARRSGPGGEGNRERGWELATAAGETLRGDRLVLAVPPDLARDLLTEAAPAVASAIPEAPSARIRLVVLVLDAPALDAHPTGTGALVAPGTPGIRAKALTHGSAKWAEVAAAARSALPDAASPHVLRLSYGRPGEPLPGREGLEDLALADASRIIGVPIAREHLVAAAVIDWDRAMRQPRPGHRAALEELTARLDMAPGLELVGAWRDGTGIEAVVRAHSVRADGARTTTLSAPTTTPTEGHPA